VVPLRESSVLSTALLIKTTTGTLTPLNHSAAGRLLLVSPISDVIYLSTPFTRMFNLGVSLGVLLVIKMTGKTPLCLLQFGHVFLYIPRKRYPATLSSDLLFLCTLSCGDVHLFHPFFPPHPGGQSPLLNLGPALYKSPIVRRVFRGADSPNGSLSSPVPQSCPCRFGSYRCYPFFSLATRPALA